MNQLIQNRKDLQQSLIETDQALKSEYKKASFDEKFKLFRELGSSFMGEESYYTGSIPGSRVSLYDDFYWERHETKSLEDILDMVQDRFEGEEADFDTYLATSDNDRVRVFRDMLENCIGTATHDW